MTSAWPWRIRLPPCRAERGRSNVVNGIGERAGNAALEEIVMAFQVRRDRFPCSVAIAQADLPVERDGDASDRSGEFRSTRPLGRNAFAHEAGIHQDGILKDRRTYEIMRAEDVGAPWNPLVLGKHSGHAVRNAAPTWDWLPATTSWKSTGR